MSLLSPHREFVMDAEKDLMTIPEMMAKGRARLAEMGFLEQESDAPETDPTGRAHRKYLNSIYFKTRYLNPVGNSLGDVDTSLTLFGARLKTPVFCCPLSGFGRGQNSLQEMALGLKNSGSLMMLGVGGYNELQNALDIGVPTVKIVKPFRKTELIREQLRYAKEHGCLAVGMDVDRYWGARRKGEWIDRLETYGPQPVELLGELIAATGLPFIIKGVLCVEDALEAVRIGASAIIVSSHGYSSISDAAPPIVVLPEIAAAVGDKIDVLIDTGFRTGNDVMKALAIGAKAVGFGSAILCAWAVGGAAGVEKYINRLTSELARAMASTGCPNLASIRKDVILDLNH